MSGDGQQLPSIWNIVDRDEITVLNTQESDQKQAMHQLEHLQSYPMHPEPIQNSSSHSKQAVYGSPDVAVHSSKDHLMYTNVNGSHQNIERLPSIHEMLQRPFPNDVGNLPYGDSSPSPHETDETQESTSCSRSGTKTGSCLGYPCDRCGRLFNRKADALKHIQVVHDKLKLFACRVCGRRFGRKDYCAVRVITFNFSTSQ